MMRRIRSDATEESTESISVAAEPAAAASLAVVASSSAAAPDETDSVDTFPKRPLSKDSSSPKGSPSSKKRKATEEEPERPESMSQAKLPFPWKLHTLLDDAEGSEDEDKDPFTDIVSWEDDGKAFRVHKPQEFCSRIMPQYFKQSKFESFTRQCECVCHGRECVE